tara:strand:- start:282 stop:557 length:276 start_codon:yes stop_codon:yes gene_type:complete
MENPMKVKVTARSISTSLGILRLDDVVDLPQDEVNKIMKMNPTAFEKMAESPVFKSTKKKAPAKKKRARNKDGTLKADDPSTPENEAWTDA